MSCARSLLLLLVCLLVTAAAYAPGLAGGFVFDDYANIVHNRAVHLDHFDPPHLRQVALSGFSGPLKRPLSMLSFGLNILATGLAPGPMKATNVAIHLGAGIFAYLLVLELLAAHRRVNRAPLEAAACRAVALATAAVWLVHPLNLTGVLYVVQRMTGLAALFTLAGLWLYCRGRHRMLAGRGGWAHIAAGLPLCGALAALAKENGALLPLFALAAEIFFFRFRCARALDRRLLLGLYAVVLLLPAVAAVAALTAKPSLLLSGYENREFSLAERLLTEPRALWLYLKLLAVPDLTHLTLYHDDFEISRSLLQPPATLAALLGIAALAALAAALWRRAPVVGFGIGFFLAGHLMESTVIPLELVHEHRNYLPGLGPVLAIAYCLLHPVLPLRERLRGGVVVVLVMLLALVTASRAQLWSNPLTMSLFEAEKHPRSSRSNYEAGRTYALLASDEHDPALRRELFGESRRFFERAAELAPHPIDEYAMLIIVTYDSGATPDPRWLAEFERRLQHDPPSAMAPAALRSLFRCKGKGVCELPDEYMDRLIRAVGANPHLRGRRRALMSFDIADYLANHVRDFRAALFFAAHAVQSAPSDPSFRVRLVELLIALGRHAEAAHEIEALRAADRFGAYNVERRRLEGLLTAPPAQREPAGVEHGRSP